MTYLPGSDEAIYPGSQHITADPCIEDDRHNVILDLSPVAYPLDGLIPTLLRAICDAGLWDEATTLVRNRTSDLRCGMALQALAAEPSIARVLKVTLTPDDAYRVGFKLADASLEPAKCARGGCVNFATVGEWCPAHDLDYRPITGQVA